jgi:eukaryotic-like serine/threonine-protein kinase
MKSQESEPPPDASRVEELFHAAAGLSAGDQATFLARECGSDTPLKTAVERLLAAGRNAATAWDRGALEVEARQSARSLVITHPGEFIGRYRIVRRIAGGGMGVVYEAVRDDAEFHKRVAIKLVQLVDDSGGIERFRAERQILAGLEHPNIAHLLDGGTTEDGTPYLVMEYVDGVPVDRFAADRRLSRNDRLTLFLQVCDAVQYAHRNLVVHRDLKPANILVAADGLPKLLDFGIAKLLSGESRSHTTIRALTPEFASPEQVLGRGVGTTSDVYSLGVLLFLLLTDRLPYRASPQQSAAFVRAVCEEEPVWEPPGLVIGDLQSVLAKALHKEPERRYLSVEQFAADIRRYLDGRPVLARPDAFLYRARKFVVRRAVPLAALAALAIAVSAGVVSTLIQSRRAERRFNDVRQLANTLIFKVHDAVAPLAGSTPVRQIIVNEGLAYLERLTADSRSDRELQQEIARAYIKIGAVQGRPNTPNLGDRQGALASFRKAEALLRPMIAAPTVTATAVRDYVDATRFLAETLRQTAGREESAAAAQLAVDAAAGFVRRQPSSDEGRVALGAAYFAAAQTADPSRRIDAWQRALQVYRSLLADQPADPVRQRNVALVEKYLSTEYEMRGEYAVALERHRAALDLDEQRAQKTPDDRVLKFDLAIDLSNIAFGLWHTGDLEAAAATYQRSLALREELASSDPKDVLARGRVALVHRQLGLLNEARGLKTEAIAQFHEAVRLANPDPSTLDGRLTLAESLIALGRLETNRADSCAAWARAFDFYSVLAPGDRRSENLSDAILSAAAHQAADCGKTEARGWRPAPSR